MVAPTGALGGPPGIEGARAGRSGGAALGALGARDGMAGRGPPSAACSRSCSWSWPRSWSRLPSRSSRSLGLVIGAIAFLLVIGALVGLARGLQRSGRTLDALVEATKRVEDGDYSVRVGTPDRGMRSVRELTQGFDTMVERLEVDERQRRTAPRRREPRAADAAGGRSPGNLEAMIDGVHPTDEPHLTAILEETRVMERLIDDLRTMALSEAGTLPLHREPTDPDVLIDDVVRSFAAAAATAGVTVQADVDGRPADPRRRSGPDPRGAGQPRGQRDPPHAGGWVGDGQRCGRRSPWLGLRGRGHGSGHRPGGAAARLRSLREGRRVPRGSGLGLAIARSLRSPWRDAGRGRHGECRDHVPSSIALAAEARRSGSRLPPLRARDPDVVDGRLDRARRRRGRPRANTIRTVWPAHGVIGTWPSPRRARRRSAAPCSWP